MFLPAGTKCAPPNGNGIEILSDSTLINQEEKEILVRNDDLWEVDKENLKQLNEENNELRKVGTVDQKEIALERERANFEKHRAEFYKEMLLVQQDLNKQNIDTLSKIAKENKPSVIQELVNKGGWVGILVTIGLIIGIAL